MDKCLRMMFPAFGRQIVHLLRSATAHRIGRRAARHPVLKCTQYLIEGKGVPLESREARHTARDSARGHSLVSDDVGAVLSVVASDRLCVARSHVVVFAEKLNLKVQRAQ